jgi:Copper transport outer membrane protein, MctB
VIDFRYHIVSIVAIFLALATGVALGAGPLKGTVDKSYIQQAERDRRDKDELRVQITHMQQVDDFQVAFTEAISPALLANRLPDRGVVLMETPDASAVTVDAVRASLTEAGAQVSYTVKLNDKLLDPANKTLVDSLATQLSAGARELNVSHDAGTYDVFGAILARALVTKQAAGSPLDDTGRNILSGLDTAKLVSVDGELARRNSLVVLVTGDANGTDQTTAASDSIVLAVGKALDEASDGVVVAGPQASAEEGGVVYAVRNDDSASSELSTVDVVDEPSGRIATVFALVQQGQGTAGQYGSVGNTDGPIPSLTGSPGQ